MYENEKDLVRDELLADEYILWAGQPNSRKLFTGVDIFLVPFSLMWGGFAIFWESMALRGGPIFFMLWGIPFVAAGLYFIFGRFIYKSYVKKRTYYYVTDKRVIILKKLRNTKLDTLYIEELPAINKNINSRGNGKIVFGDSAGIFGMYENTGLDFYANRFGKVSPAFYDLEGAEEAYRLVCKIKDGAYK